jgi:tryptophan 2,3-dioxygenase
MTPLDFLEFRHLLAPSSGFQSLQFRIVESKLGLRMSDRYKKEYYARTGDGGLTPADLEYLQKTENESSLVQLLNTWLERMPFFDTVYWKNFETDDNKMNSVHPFWKAYKTLYTDGLDSEPDKLLYFDKLFEEVSSEPNVNYESDTAFSNKALQAALFIMLYRDFPVFQTSYQILDSLIEIDHLMAGWRHKHMVMVRRMIGMRQGTGNTSGAGYLQGALENHFVFKDLEHLSTFLIERKKLPKLPKALIVKLSYVN